MHLTLRTVSLPHQWMYRSLQEHEILTVVPVGEERRRKAALSGACICRNSHVHVHETNFFSCLQKLLGR